MLQGTGQAVCGGAWQEDHEKGPCGGNRAEQPNPAFQSRDLQDPPRCQPHNRGGCPRCHGQDWFGKTNRIRPDNEIYQGVRLNTMNKQMTKKKAKTRVQY